MKETVSIKFEAEILEAVRQLKDRVLRLEDEIEILKQPKDDLSEWLDRKQRKKLTDSGRV